MKSGYIYFCNIYIGVFGIRVSSEEDTNGHTNDGERGSTRRRGFMSEVRTAVGL